MDPFTILDIGWFLDPVAMVCDRLADIHVPMNFTRWWYER